VRLGFQASLGLEGMLDPAIYDGSGVAKALAQIVGGGVIVGNLLMYRDDNHLTTSAVLLLKPYLDAVITAALADVG